jgi:sodium/hydrogen antiporter
MRLEIHGPQSRNDFPARVGCARYPLELQSSNLEPVSVTEHFAATLALIGIVILVSSLLSGVVERTGLPQVAIFLLLGVLLGPAGLGLLELPLRSPTLNVIATLALVLVLFTDAISVDVADLTRNRRLALLVLGPGTIVPAVLLALFAWLLLRLSIPESLILGAALASTDPVLLRNLIRRTDIPSEARAALRLESGMNDVVLLPIVVVSILALQSAAAMGAGASGIAGVRLGRHLVGLFVLGPLLGAVIGWLAITLLDQVRRRFTVRRDYESLYALGVAFSAFAAAEAVGGSGFLAGFFAGIVIASLDVELCDCFLDYGQASAEMFLLLTFVAFGTSAIWSGLSAIDWRTLLFAFIALGVRTAVLLPVLRRAGADDRSRRIIAWFGPRGLSTLLLVLLPLVAGVQGADRLFSVAALVVLLSVVIHGSGVAIYLRREPGGTTDRTRELPVLAPRESEGPKEVEKEGDEIPDADRVTVDELRELWRRGEEVIVIDARTDRTWRQDALQARGAIRIPPEDALRSVRQARLAQHANLVVYCA